MMRFVRRDTFATVLKLDVCRNSDHGRMFCRLRRNSSHKLGMRVEKLENLVGARECICVIHVDASYDRVHHTRFITLTRIG